jgi:hypothetical protein
VVDALCTAQDLSARKMRWLAIREKLHTLKGGLKTMKSKESLSEIVRQLNSLCSSLTFLLISQTGGPMSGRKSKQSLLLDVLV